jgi:hypothetical protein
MVMGHLLCGVIFGAMVCVGCALLGLSLAGITASFFIGANLGLGLSTLATLVPWPKHAAKATSGEPHASGMAGGVSPAE